MPGSVSQVGVSQAAKPLSREALARSHRHARGIGAANAASATGPAPRPARAGVDVGLTGDRADVNIGQLIEELAEMSGRSSAGGAIVPGAPSIDRRRREQQAPRHPRHRSQLRVFVDVCAPLSRRRMTNLTLNFSRPAGIRGVRSETRISHVEPSTTRSNMPSTTGDQRGWSRKANRRYLVEDIGPHS